jgi:hypothetical protein
MSLRDLVVDIWSPLSHKEPMRANGRGTDLFRRSYLSEFDRRRLTAYHLLAAYQANVARSFLGDSSGSGLDEHREYGDPAMIVKTITAALLGKDQAIRVRGAEDYDPTSATSQGEAADSEARMAYDVQQYLRDWADKERLPLKMLDNERRTVGLGDGVYALHWSRSKGRARLRVYDPGFYFPVLDDNVDDDFPTRVHFAWEVTDEWGNATHLRRITYELGPIRPESEPGLIGGAVRRVLRYGDNGLPKPLFGDRIVDIGLGGGDPRIARRYSWNAADSSTTCFLTDATWRLADIDQTMTLDTLPLSRATFQMNEDGELLDRLDLRIDFLPVIHIPNTPATIDHFGTSSISDTLQLFDDLAAADTDLNAAAATTGSPPIGLAGARLPVNPDGGPAQVTIAPGEVWELGENGKLHALDTSNSLNALRAYVHDLNDRVTENSRVTAAVLGRVKPSEVPSGLALALGFGPLQALIRELRLTRNEKYPLLFKFVQRLALAAGELPATRELPAEMVFGAFLPSDVAEVVKNVRQLLTPPQAISVETAVAMLMEVGLPIEDAAAEVQRIRQHDYESANKLADATGDQTAVRDLLGLAPQNAPLPVIPLPGLATPLPGSEQGDQQ